MLPIAPHTVTVTLQMRLVPALQPAGDGQAGTARDEQGGARLVGAEPGVRPGVNGHFIKPGRGSSPVCLLI